MAIKTRYFTGGRGSLLLYPGCPNPSWTPGFFYVKNGTQVNPVPRLYGLTIFKILGRLAFYEF